MNDSNTLRFAVVQPGPRLHYAVPTLLERAGMLQCFYTDICASIGPLRILDHLWPANLRPPAIERMFARRLPSDLPRAKVHQIPATCLGNALARKLGTSEAASTAKSLLKRALAENLGGANAIYTVIVNEDLEFCRQAFVLPSLSEGLPMAVLEAWSYGLPVLMTNACNLPEGVEAGAAMRMSIDTNKMSRDIAVFLGLDRNRLAAMGSNGLRLVKDRFNWPSVAARMRDVYTWLVDGGIPPPSVRLH